MLAPDGTFCPVCLLMRLANKIKEVSVKYQNRVPQNSKGKRMVPTKAEQQQQSKKDNAEYYQNGTAWHTPRR